MIDIGRASGAIIAGDQRALERIGGLVVGECLGVSADIVAILAH